MHLWKTTDFQTRTKYTIVGREWHRNKKQQLVNQAFSPLHHTAELGILRIPVTHPLQWWRHTDIHMQQGPSYIPVSPSVTPSLAKGTAAYGKSASRTLCPVSSGWLAGSFSVTGRTCLTGHTCIMVNFSLTPSNSSSSTTSCRGLQHRAVINTTVQRRADRTILALSVSRHTILLK